MKCKSETRWINAVWFQIVWWGMVYQPNFTIPIAALCILAHFWYLEGSRRREGAFVLFSGAVGLLTDTGLAYVGLMSFYPSSVDQVFPPLWLVLLWFSFSCTLRHSLDWVVRKIWIGVPLGALGGVATYLGADRLGAIEILAPKVEAGVYLGVIWAFLFAFFWWLEGQVKKLS